MRRSELKRARSHLRRAVVLCGGITKFGELLGMSPQRAHYYVNVAKVIKAPLAIEIETATGGKVSRRDIRPDIQGDW